MIIYFSSVSKVSTTWKKILEDDKVALQLYNKAIQRITVSLCSCFKTFVGILILNCHNFLKTMLGNSLAIQWLGLYTLPAWGLGSIPS